jgi:glycosyltransferase domain-containing protein
MDKVAIIVPTMSRSRFLQRLISFYNNVPELVTLYIGDSSDTRELQITKAFLDKKFIRVEIHHFSFPGMSTTEVYGKVAPSIKEKYVAICGDDDLLLPNSISKCRDFLAENNEYVSAQGSSILFQMRLSLKDRMGAYFIHHKTYCAAEKENSFERVLEFAESYWVPHFSIVRKDAFIRAIEVNKKITDQKLGELYLSFNIIALGKSKFMDGAHVLRQDHGARILVRTGIEDWALNLKESGLWNVAIRDLGRIFNDNTDTKDGENSARQCYESFLKISIKNLKNKYRVSKKIKNLLFNLIVLSAGQLGPISQIIKDRSLNKVAKKTKLTDCHVTEIKSSIELFERYEAANLN